MRKGVLKQFRQDELQRAITVFWRVSKLEKILYLQLRWRDRIVKCAFPVKTIMCNIQADVQKFDLGAGDKEKEPC